jgi:hypothetical protein
VGYDYVEDSWAYVDAAGFTSPEPSLEAAVRHLDEVLGQGMEEHPQSAYGYESMLDDLREFVEDDLMQGHITAIDDALNVIRNTLLQHEEKKLAGEVESLQKKLEREFK